MGFGTNPFRPEALSDALAQGLSQGFGGNSFPKDPLWVAWGGRQMHSCYFSNCLQRTGMGSNFLAGVSSHVGWCKAGVRGDGGGENFVRGTEADAGDLLALGTCCFWDFKGLFEG